LVYDDVSINGGYVVVLSGENLKLCNKNMVVSIVVSLVNPTGLSAPNGWVLCYGPYGEAYNITPLGEALPVFIDAGWRYGFWDDHSVVYQARMVVDVYPDEIKVYGFDEFLNYSFPITDGFVVVWMDGSYSVYLRDIGLAKDKVGYPEYPVVGDYCVVDDTMCLVDGDGAVYLITPTSSSTYYTGLQGSILPVRVYHRNGDYYVAIANISEDGASLSMYVGFSLVRRVTVNVSPDEFGAFFSMDDIDSDGTYEYAYSLYAYNGSGIEYMVGVYDGDVLYSDHGYISKSIATYPECAVFSFHNSFVVRSPENQFIRVFQDASTETHTLAGNTIWASSGILISTGEIRLINEQGQLNLDVDGIYRGVGIYDKWTKSIVLAKNYTIYNITGSIDKASPTINIISPEEGEQIDSSLVNISWEVYDDLLLTSVMLRVDDGEWMDVFGLSSYVVCFDCEGNHTVYLNATDIANRSTVISRTFVVDVPIGLGVVCVDNGSWINRSWTIVGWCSYGYVENVSIIANGSVVYFTESDLNGSYNLSLGEGYWDIEVRAMSEYDVLSRRICVWVDVTPPVVGVLEPENNSVVETNESFAMITLRVNASDNFGVDLTPPELVVLEPENNSVFYTNDTWAVVSLRVNVTDNVGVERIELIYGGQRVEMTEENQLILGAGEYYLKIVAFDFAGNINFKIIHLVVESVGSTVHGDDEDNGYAWVVHGDDEDNGYAWVLLLSIAAGIVVGVYIVRRRG